MNWLDVVVVIILIAITFAAYSAGLIREVITLVASIAGIIVAGQLYDNLAKDVLVFINNEDAAEAVSFLSLFGAVWLLGQIGAYVLKTGAALLMLGPLDHLGGAAFGFVKGLIVVQVLLITFAAYPSLDLDGSVRDSEVARWIVDDFSFLLNVLPGEFDDRVDQFQDPGPSPSPSPAPAAAS